VKSSFLLLLHCLPIKNGAVIPRPLGSQLHATLPGEILHMDYVYIDTTGWLLVLKDDLSGLIDLSFSTTCESSHVVDAAELACSFWNSSFYYHGSSFIFHFQVD